MITQNLILTEKAISRHTKRLIKELAKINHEVKLSEAQNMLSRILGLKDFHELKQILNFEQTPLVEPVNSIVNPNEELDFFLNINSFITLDYAKENLEKFFSEGSIDIVLKFLNSDNTDIQEYIEHNAVSFFMTAANHNQVFLLQNLINKKLIDLNNFTEQDIKDLYYKSLNYNNGSLEAFNYVFYKLKFPQTLSQYLVGMITHYLATMTSVEDVEPHLHRFLTDERVSFQKDFYWNKTVVSVNNKGKSVATQYDFSSCVLNSACAKGNLQVVKYLIKEQKLVPFDNGATVKSACTSGNLELVKYLINDIKAPFHYFKKNTHKKLSNKDMTYSLDFSTLSCAVKSGNLELVKYLIHDKKLNLFDYDYLALRVALIESSDIFKYFLVFPEYREYIKLHAQEIFEQVIYKIHYHNTQNYKKLQQNQYDIALTLLSYYGVGVKEVVTVNDNAKLIELLQKCVENNALFINILSHENSFSKDSDLLDLPQKTCVIISPSEVICKSLKLFLQKNDKLDNIYQCYTFLNLNDYKHYISFNPQKIDFIICDNDIILDNDINCPIIYLSEKSKEDVFYLSMCKLFFSDYIQETIHDLKNYINLHLGQVDFKFWYLLLTSYQKISNKSQFDKTVLTFCHKFDLKENFNFDTFVFIPENMPDKFLLAKPFSKEDVTKILSYIEIFS